MKAPNIFLGALIAFLCGLVTAPVVALSGFSTEIPDTLDPFDKRLQDEIEFNVPVITCEELHQLIANSGPFDLYLLDARDPKEFSTSHLKGAIRIGYDDFSTERIWMIERDAIVVVYCGAGTRSEEIGVKMMEMGFTNVKNLYGSIVEWINQGYKAVDDNGKPTEKIFFTDKKRSKGGVKKP